MIVRGDMRQVEWTHDPAEAVVVTDPPFGIEGKGFESPFPWWFYVKEALAVPAKRHVIRGPAHLIVQRDIPEPRRIHVEYAAMRRGGGGKPGAVSYRWHGWVIYGDLRVGSGYRTDVTVIRDLYGDDSIGRLNGDAHAGMTPLESAAGAVATWTDPGDLVVDPFAGTGTIGLVALRTRRRYLGVEINESWATVAEERIASATEVLFPELG